MIIKDEIGEIVYDDTPVTVEILAARIDKMQATMDQILTLVAVVKEEVTPFLDSLGKSPIVKMLGIKM